MKFVNALAVVLLVSVAILTYLALGPLSGIFSIWAVFVFIATGVAIGGTNEAFKNLVICGFLGVVLAWLASLIILSVPLAASLTLPVWAAIVVGILASFIGWMANLPIFGAVPATVVGFACTFAYLLQTKGMLATKVLLSLNVINPLVLMAISLVVAAGSGIAIVFMTGKLTAKQPVEVAGRLPA